MSKLFALSVTFALFAVGIPQAHAQLLEGASVYAKGGGFGAGLGAAIGGVQQTLTKNMNKALGGGAAASPQKRRAADESTKTLLLWAQKEEKQGHTSAAMDLYRQLGQTRRQMLGVSDQQTQAAFQKAGDLALKEKKSAVAEEYYKQGLSEAVHCYGPGTPELIPALSKMADVCRLQGEYHDADNYLTQVYALSERKYGKNDSHTAAAREQLCTVLKAEVGQLQQDGRVGEATAIQQRLLSLEPATTAGAGNAGSADQPATATPQVVPAGATETSAPSAPASGAAASPVDTK